MRLYHSVVLVGIQVCASHVLTYIYLSSYSKDTSLFSIKNLFIYAKIFFRVSYAKVKNETDEWFRGSAVCPSVNRPCLMNSDC